MQATLNESSTMSEDTGEADVERTQPAIEEARPLLTMGTDAFRLLTAALVLAVAGGITFLLGGLVAAIVTWVFAGCLAFVGAIVGLMTLPWSRATRRMFAGDYLVHWVYDENQWRQHIDREGRKLGWATWIAAGIFAVGSLGAAAGAHEDGNLVGGSAATHYLVIVGGAAVAGYFCGMLVRWSMEDNLRRRQAYGGRAVIGHTGLYITGQYWPWSTFGQRVIGVTRRDGDLVFAFRVQTKNGHTVNDVLVPVPPGEERTAEEFVRHFDAILR